jgi:tetratricopeptide (TPR) repeat protein
VSGNGVSGPGLEGIRDLLRAGAMAQADALVDSALAHDANDAEALYFRGVIANRRRDFPGAVDALRRAVAVAPAVPLAWLALGNAQARMDRYAEAADAYREVIAREPWWADAHYNLGLMLRHMGDLYAAARSLHAAWTRDPMMFDAAKQCMATLAQVARGPQDRIVRPPPVALPEPAPSVDVVICSIDDAKHDRVVALYRSLFVGVPCRIVAIRDARSLAEAYNRAVRASTADIVVLSHDDVDILAADFAPRLLRALQTVDVVGVVGSTRMQGPTVGWAGHPHLRGWITHHSWGEREWQVDVLDPRPLATGAVLLDGVFLAAKRRVLNAIPFDAATFDGFHLYDVDWTYRAANAGFHLGVVADLLLVHASRGGFSDDWQRYADRFCAKYRTGSTPPAESSFFGATLDGAAQVTALLGLLRQLALEMPQPVGL